MLIAIVVTIYGGYRHGKTGQLISLPNQFVKPMSSQSSMTVVVHLAERRDSNITIDLVHPFASSTLIRQVNMVIEREQLDVSLLRILGDIEKNLKKSH